MAGQKPLPVPAAASGDPASDEEHQVHEVYEAIAPHFARTRFKVRHPAVLQGDLAVTLRWRRLQLLSAPARPPVESPAFQGLQRGTAR